MSLRYGLSEGRTTSTVPDDELKYDWKFLLDQMNPEDEAELRQIAEMKIERRRKDQSLKSLKTKRAGDELETSPLQPV
jgi:hypothetical protein